MSTFETYSLWTKAQPAFIARTTQVTERALGNTLVRRITKTGCATRAIDCDPLRKTKRSFAVITAILMALFIVTTQFTPKTSSIATHSLSCSGVKEDLYTAWKTRAMATIATRVTPDISQYMRFATASVFSMFLLSPCALYMQ